MAHRADTRSQAEDQALRWLVDFENLSEVEQARFHAWLDEHPENPEAFERIEREWRRLDSLRRMAGKRPDPEVAGKWLRRRRARRLYASVAAAACAAVLVFGLFVLPAGTYEDTFRTDVGQHLSVALPDESVMTLNTATEALVRFDGRERRVRLLRGEAHFLIASAPARPFFVEAGSRTIRALGTAFSVFLHNDALKVTVTEGEVEVLPAAAEDGSEPGAASRSRNPGDDRQKAERLASGQRLEYRDTRVSITLVDPAALARELAWREGMLDFHGERLAEVIEEAGRYTETAIAIVDPELKDLKVTGYLRAGDIDTLLALIESDARVSVHRVAPGRVHITASREQ